MQCRKLPFVIHQESLYGCTLSAKVCTRNDRNFSEYMLGSGGEGAPSASALRILLKFRVTAAGVDVRSRVGLEMRLGEVSIRF